jgi:hypothetical protein
MECVLPLRFSGVFQRHDFARARLLVHSLEHFWAASDPLALHIIAHDRDADIIAEMIRSEKLRIQVLPETAVLPCLAALPNVFGWLKQQALKIAAHRIVKGAFYLTLDADVICTKPFDDGSLIVGDRALTDWEPRAMHAAWWTGSADFLQQDCDTGRLGLAVTPAILATGVARALEARLHHLHGDAAYTRLLTAKHRWSEYSLYCLFAEGAGLMQQNHLTAAWMNEHNRSLRGPDNCWLHSQFATWNPARSFGAASPGYFVVCQSSTGIPASRVWQRVAEFLPGSPF